MLEKTNLLGAIVALTFYFESILVFISRLFGKPHYSYWIGYFQFLLTIPLIFLLLKASVLKQPTLYYIQIGSLLLWLAIEALLDYILKIDFRNINWLVIIYVILFFAGAGGMLGVAIKAKAIWKYSAIILFWLMTFLAFVQRYQTGM